MKPSRIAATVLCIFAFAVMALSQSTAVCSSVQELNLPGNLISQAQGINDAGAVVGVLEEGVRTTDVGFLLYRGKVTLFMYPKSVTTAASDINRHAQIVGTYADRANIQHGFMVHSGGFHTIDVPGATGTHAISINSFGDIVGYYTDAAQHAHAFILHNGLFTRFSYPAAVNTRANGINDSGAVVGTFDDGNVDFPTSHGFLRKNGALNQIDFPGANNTFANKINNAGKIVGTYQDCCFQRGFSLVNDVFTIIDESVPTTSTNILGVNNLDQIVGAFATSDSFMPAGQAFQANCTSVF